MECANLDVKYERYDASHGEVVMFDHLCYLPCGIYTLQNSALSCYHGTKD